jgi:putative flippase GtrA
MQALLANAEIARFVRFACVGGTGFLVDAGILMLLHNGIGLDPYSSRVISIAIAVFTTWRLNRSLTFGASSASQAAEGLRYFFVAVLTACLNYAVYALVLMVLPSMPPVLAAVVATVVAMGFSYAGYSRFVFAGAGLSQPR